MKKKKRTAARMLTPTKRATVRAAERRLARVVADAIRNVKDKNDTCAYESFSFSTENSTVPRGCFFSANLPNGVRLERYKDFGSWFESLIRKIDNPAGFLRLVADALEGKLRGAKHDDAIKEAYWKVWQKCFNDERWNVLPLVSEIDNALTSTSDKPLKPANRKDIEPLTRKEKQTIRDLELIGCSHTVIEKDIGRCYKRTENGDYVAVNENGDAALAKRTVKLKKPTERDLYRRRALRRRLEILGYACQKPGRPPKVSGRP